VGFNCALRHLEFAGNFRVVTPLQQEIGDLLLPRAQTNSRLPHGNYQKSLNPRSKVADAMRPFHTHTFACGVREKSND
jgi:hypothetical protein